MEDRFEKRLKELLPYMIITAALFLLLPLLMGKQAGAVTYVIQLGAFPLTALGCGFHFAYRKGRKDIIVCVLAPVFYALTALIYGMWRDSWINVLIYMVAYFICGYLGMMLCDLVKPRSKKGEPRAKTPRRRPQRPRRVNLEQEELNEPEFKAEDPSADISLDTSTTDNDIEDMLQAIHDRKSQ